MDRLRDHTVRKPQQNLGLHKIRGICFNPGICLLIISPQHQKTQDQFPLFLRKAVPLQLLQVFIQCLQIIRIEIGLYQLYRNLTAQLRLHGIAFHQSCHPHQLCGRFGLFCSAVLHEIQIQFCRIRHIMFQKSEIFPRYQQFFQGIFHIFKEPVTICILKSNGIIIPVDCHPGRAVLQRRLGQYQIPRLADNHLTHSAVIHSYHMGKQQTGQRLRHSFRYNGRRQEFLIQYCQMSVNMLLLDLVNDEPLHSRLVMFVQFLIIFPVF